MKVLFVTSHISNTSSPIFMRNQTGFGYMVFDIAESVSKLNKVDIFIANTFSPSMVLGDVNVIGRSWWSYFRGLSVCNVVDALNFIKRYKLPLKRSLRELYMYTTLSQIRLILNKYDVVHIHGCSEITDSVIRMCKKVNVPFVITLHGLNSFEESIKLHPSLKQYERDFLKEAVLNEYILSFISTGNRNTAERFIGNKVASFRVICNGCNIKQKPVIVDIRKKYNIANDDFVFAFVGNVSINKNQVQVARAWNLLPEEKRRKCKVLFVGRYTCEDELINYIQSNNLEENLIVCGMQPKESVSDFYHACDATILTSLTEGFGLSIIEGFVYGKPNVTFADLPATLDLYDEKTMVLAEDRKDETLAEAMLKVMLKKFNSEYISRFSIQFSFERMAQMYNELYKSVVK